MAETNFNVTTVKDILPDDLLFDDKDVQEYFDMVYYGTSDIDNFLIGNAENTMLLIIVFNMYLLLNKNKTTTKRSNSTKTLSVNYENPKNEKKVRTLGKIKITSIKAPKAHTNVVTIRKYKCASWTVRAHVRHYKNGKVSIIKEQTRYRKNMNKIEPAQRVMKFKP